MIYYIMIVYHEGILCVFFIFFLALRYTAGFAEGTCELGVTILSVSHLLPYFGGVACWMAELKTALREKKNIYFFFSRY